MDALSFLGITYVEFFIEFPELYKAKLSCFFFVFGGKKLFGFVQFKFILNLY